MRNIVLLFVSLFYISTSMYSQNFTLSPNPQTNGICPNVNRTFTVNGISADCSGFTLSLQSGNAIFTTTGNTFTVNALNIPQELKIKYLPGTDPDCGGEQTFTIPVLSVSNKVPTITGCPAPVVRGMASTITLTAAQLYEFRGTADPTEVAPYTWAISSGGTGWTFTTANAIVGGFTVLRKTATFTTDNCSGATISVFATDICGNTSFTGTCTISRVTERPTISGAPPFVVCCNTSPISLSAVQPTTGLVGYTYTWNFGSWTGTSSGATSTVTPNGTSAGNVSVVATACGVNSVSSTKAIPLEIIDPSTTVNGDSHLCIGESSPFSISPDLQSCASTTWSVSPPNAVGSSSGNGNSANLSPGTLFNGNATITFTINTPCGSVTKSKSFFVGKPIISDINLPTCFHKYETYAISVASQGGTSYSWAVPSCGLVNNPTYWDPSCWHISTVMPNPAPQVIIYTGEKSGSISVWVTNECGTVSMMKPIIWCNPQIPGPGPKYPFRGGGGSGNRSIENEYNGEIFKLYPNPTTGNLTIEFVKPLEDKIEMKQIQIFNMQGQEVSKENTAAIVYQKDVSYFTNGTYFVKVISNGKVYDATFVKTE